MARNITSRDDPDEQALNLGTPFGLKPNPNRAADIAENRRQTFGTMVPAGTTVGQGAGGHPVNTPLKPEQIPANLHRDEYDPFGYDDDPHEEARLKAIKALPKGSSNATVLNLMEAYPYPDEKPSAEQEFQMEYTHPGGGPDKGRWSDDPKFKHVQMVEGPRLHPDGSVSRGPKLQWNIDPEKHIERTSNAPGAEGSPPGDRALDQLQGKPVPAYGGSVDARSEKWGAHKSTAEVWQGKGIDVLHPAGATEPMLNDQGVPMRDKQGQMRHQKVHGAGLYDALMSGEDVRSPIHLIRDPEEPIYGPRRVQPYQTSPGGPTHHLDYGDAGGFGHDEPVQWQGHHRAKAGALKQQKQREEAEAAGTAAEGGWSVPVPFKLHEGRDDAISAMTWGAGMPGVPGISEQLTERMHKARMANFQATAGPGMSAGASAPTPKRVLGGRMAPGTWNPKAY